MDILLYQKDIYREMNMEIDVLIECDCGEQIIVKSITTKDCPRCGRIYNLVLNKNYELVAQIID